MADALSGFIELECDDRDLVAGLRAAIEQAEQTRYAQFGFNLFDVELFFSEDRVTVTEAVPLGYNATEVTLTQFLTALPDVSSRAWKTLPRRVIVPPPPQRG